MDWLHGILNLTGLLLWVSWRAGTMPRSQPPRNLAGPTPRQGPIYQHSWIYLLVLLALLSGRAVFYNQFGPGLDWIPSMNMVFDSPHFRSDFFPRALAYSILSFGRWMVALYFCLALMVLVKPITDSALSWREFLKAQFGWLGNLPPLAQCAVAVAMAAGLHAVELEWMLDVGIRAHMADPVGGDYTHQIPALLLLDLRATIYLIMALLALYLLNSFVYFGERTFWKTVDESGKRLLTPLRILPWETRKMDFAPIVALAIAYGLSHALTPEHVAGLLR